MQQPERWHRQVIKGPRPPTRCWCHLCPYCTWVCSFHLVADIQYAYFPVYFVLLDPLVEKRQVVPRKTVKVLKTTTNAYSLYNEAMCMCHPREGQLGGFMARLPGANWTLALVVPLTSVQLGPSVLFRSPPSWTCFCSAVTKSVCGRTSMHFPFWCPSVRIIGWMVTPMGVSFWWKESYFNFLHI